VKTKIAVGAEIDFLTDGELRKALQDHRDVLSKMLRDVPIPRTPDGTVITDAAGNGVIDLGNPGLGRTWNVRRVSASGQDPTAAAGAVNAYLYRDEITNPANFVCILSTTLPRGIDKEFSADQLVLGQDEHLLVRITGGGAAVAFFASAQVVEGRKGTVYEIDVEAPKLSSVV
jgi:hypothetical protein